jgi:5-methyltetrahydropteroyltriglutamate--homocysteine methyltransferase
MVLSTNLGYPRIGAKRQLKTALENYWSGRLSAQELINESKSIKRDNWILQRAAGIDHIPSNDFSFYDPVLDTCIMLGAIPERFKTTKPTLDNYFDMARGAASIPAMEMTKWFDTNYHYIVPEFTANSSYKLKSLKPVEEFEEARSLGIETRPVILGPVTFALLGKYGPGINTLTVLDHIVSLYGQLLEELSGAGAEWVQIDEPTLVLDLTKEIQNSFVTIYDRLCRPDGRPKIVLATYFGALGDNLPVVSRLPVEAIHCDLVRAPNQLQEVLDSLPEHQTLSLGIVNGRNIWRTNLRKALAEIETAINRLGKERVMVGPSCSLFHTPVDKDLETNLNGQLFDWISFAKQKLYEITLLSKAAEDGTSQFNKEFERSDKIFQERSQSSLTFDPVVRERTDKITQEMYKRKSSHNERKRIQNEALNLPLLPTTTIGSFPQTKEIRAKRKAFRNGHIKAADYEEYLKEETKSTIKYQEEIGLDVLVHGEFERTDMVEYFGEQLKGFAFTEFGWVQSYGSRCVRPPIIYGDVSRPSEMTVRWSQYAQGCTHLPVKGMLTGPVTILQWSFVRDDQPVADTCRQISLALRDEVLDLERARLKIIQVDEPAIREGLPLNKRDWNEYLEWSVECFQLATTGVADSTQIHTHMCYSEFNEIIEAIARMDADVISIESSRSGMDLLESFRSFNYSNDIGPGVYDIHSPRVPAKEEIIGLIQRALSVLSTDQLWINPDCGLKTRNWDEIGPALANMVAAARYFREKSSR